MTMQQVFDSAFVPPAHRRRYWSDVVSALAGNVGIEPIGADTLDGRMRICNLGQLRLSKVQLSQCRVFTPSNYSGMRSGFEIMFQTQGQSSFVQGGFETVIGPGECLAFDNSLPFTLENETDSVIHMIDIPYELVTRKGVPYARLAGAAPSDASVVRIAYNALLGVERELESLPPHMMVGVSTALTDFLLLPFTASAASVTALHKSAALRARVKGYISANLNDPMLSVARIAKAVGCTKRYLHMLFKEEQTTLSRYIWVLRLQRAKEMIEHAGAAAPVSITDIAFSLGFSSSSHFCRLFKHEFGILPSELKRTQRQPVSSPVAEMLQ